MKSASSPTNDDIADSRFENLRRLVDEIQLTASLEHPSVVRFLAVAWDSMAIESLCLITEYLSEGNLQDHLHVTRYPTWTHRKLRFAIGVANALKYLHSLKAPSLSSSSSSAPTSSFAATTATILHRDVRAKNVGLSHTFEPKLVNIGAKHSFSNSPELIAAGDGNAFWTAPEVLSGQKYSEKSDIYAFGVLLSEIDTNGTLPYANTIEETQQLRPFQVLNLVASGKLRPSFAQNCPVRIREIAAMCLCNDPAQRVNAAALPQLLESYGKTLAQ
jgi:serine/threonine protein kinase